MIPLNLPSFEYKLKKAEGKLWIFDVIRKKYIVLIPEEWVRQHFIHFLIDVHHYPKSLIRVEGGLQYNQLQKRTDIVIFDRTGKPWMIVECKAPEVPVNEKTVFQVSTYNSTLRARYITVTNGLTHLYASTDWNTGSTGWLNDIPVFGNN
jgi:hypothetical protein